jgi:hypothetical protein
MEKELAQYTHTSIPTDAVLYAKQIGFSDKQIARCLGILFLFPSCLFESPTHLKVLPYYFGRLP